MMNKPYGLFFISVILLTSKSAMGLLGIHGGISTNSVSTPSDITSSARTGFVLGVNAEVPLGGVFYVQPEVSFVQKGAQLVDAQGVKLSAKYNAIEVPVFLKTKFGEKVSPYLFAGPNIIFNTSRSIEVEVAGQTSSVSFKPRTVDFALDFGGGLEVGAVFANLRYSLGIVDLDEESANWRSRGFQILLGIKFL